MLFLLDILEFSIARVFHEFPKKEIPGIFGKENHVILRIPRMPARRTTHSRKRKRTSYRTKKSRKPATRRTAKRKTSVRRKRYSNAMDVVKGFGAYTSLGNIDYGNSPPVVKNSKAGGFIVRHREFITDVPSSVAFVSAQYPLNPGLAQTFPWLSQIANQFEEWVPRGMLFEYKTTSSDAVVATNANAALGSVILATEYNPYNGAFASKVQMENYEWAVSTKPSRSLIHEVECAKAQNPLGVYYVRNQAVPSGQDQRFFDLGLFQIASVGMQSNNALCGELWCTYEIEFRKPRLNVGGTEDSSTEMDHFQVSTATANVTHLLGNTTGGLLFPTTQSTLGGAVSPGAVNTFAPSPTTPTQNNFATGIPVLDGNGNPTGAVGNGVADTYYFPPGVSKGNYMLLYESTWTNTGAVPTITVGGTNVSLLNLLTGDTASSEINNAATTSTTVTFCLFVTVTKANAHVTFGSAGGGMTTILGGDLFVIQLPTPMN